MIVNQFDGVPGRLMEANYTFPVYRGVTVEPAIQYFVNPNADRRVKDAVVFAGRLHINF